MDWQLAGRIACSELTPNALENDGGRVGTRALVCLNFDRYDERHCAELTLELFGYTDNCPGCANARAGRKQAVDHLEKCGSEMETFLSTTEGHERLEGALDRFSQLAEEPGVVEAPRKSHRLEGEQPLAPSASTVLVRRNYQEGSSSNGGSALPLAPPPLEPPPLGKRSLEQETEMTDATVEQL